MAAVISSGHHLMFLWNVSADEGAEAQSQKRTACPAEVKDIDLQITQEVDKGRSVSTNDHSWQFVIFVTLQSCWVDILNQTEPSFFFQVSLREPLEISTNRGRFHTEQKRKKNNNRFLVQIAQSSHYSRADLWGRLALSKAKQNETNMLSWLCFLKA